MPYQKGRMYIVHCIIKNFKKKFLIWLKHYQKDYFIQSKLKFKVHTSKILNNTSTTQYLFKILYLPTQIQMDIVYRKPGFKLIIIISFVSKKTIDMFLKAKISLYNTNF